MLVCKNGVRRRLPLHKVQREGVPRAGKKQAPTLGDDAWQCLSRGEVGQKAFDALYRNLAGESNMREEIKVSTTLILTQSTAAVHQER